MILATLLLEKKHKLPTGMTQSQHIENQVSTVE